MPIKKLIFLNFEYVCALPGKCLLIVNGAKCHLDLSIADEAFKHNITLFCLPSNTTHELQPMDKSLFKPLETAWDNEVQLYWEINQTRELSKIDFCKIFKKVWLLSATPRNVAAGFKACGICPYNPAKIPDVAFAPSSSTEIIPRGPTPVSPQRPTLEPQPGPALVPRQEPELVSSQEPQLVPL